MHRFPLTPLGWAACIGILLSYAIGWALGWIEFLVVAIGLLLALVSAIPFVVGGRRLRIERRVEPQRVRVGEAASSHLVVSNESTAPSAPRTIEDRIGGSVTRIDVPSIAGGGTTTSVTPLPTGRRQVVDIGPAIVTQADPLGLLRVDLGRTGVEKLWVHPNYQALASARAGFAKDLDGPTFDNSPAGDVAFHTIREYERGDDVRHIHWMSTARAGNLMIRHFVDNRRPYLGVLVDDRRSQWHDERFETAIEIAASQVVSAELDNRPIALWVGEQQVVTTTQPADRQEALDRLCLSSQTDHDVDPVEAWRALRTVDRDVSTLLLITGPASAAELMPVTIDAARHGNVMIARVVPIGEPRVSVPRATVVDCHDLDGFAAVWEGLVR